MTTLPVAEEEIGVKQQRQLEQHRRCSIEMLWPKMRHTYSIFT